MTWIILSEKYEWLQQKIFLLNNKSINECVANVDIIFCCASIQLSSSFTTFVHWMENRYSWSHSCFEGKFLWETWLYTFIHFFRCVFSLFLSFIELYLEGEPWRSIKATMRSWVHVLKTASCRNAGKDCVHKTQSGWTFPRTLRKRELHAPGWPFFISLYFMKRGNMGSLSCCMGYYVSAFG
jgi:hypothetical protein